MKKGVLQFEKGVLLFEKGVLLFEKGVLLFEKGVLLFEKGVLLFEKGVLLFEKGVLLFEKGVLPFEKGVLLFEKGVLLSIYLFIYLLCFANFTQSYLPKYKHKNIQTINQSINGRVYATALRQLQQPLQNEQDTLYIRSLVIYKASLQRPVIKKGQFAIWKGCFAICKGSFAIWKGCFAIWKGCFAIWKGCFAIWKGCFAIWKGSFAIWKGSFAIWKGCFAIWKGSFAIYIFIYLFIMLCQFHTIISAQIQTQEYTNYQSINQWQGICYSFTPITAALTERTFDTLYIRSLVIYKASLQRPVIKKGQFAIWKGSFAIWKGSFALWKGRFAIWKGCFAIWKGSFAIYIFIYLFIMLCQIHTIISAQIQTQEYTNCQSINQSMAGYMLQLYANYSSPYRTNMTHSTLDL